MNIAWLPALSLASALWFAQVGVAQSPAPSKLGACVLQIDGLGEPTGVAFSSDGSMYVAESLARQVSVIDRKGKTIRTLGDGRLGDPRDVAISEDGRIIVSDAGVGGLIVFEASGKASVLEVALPGRSDRGAPEGIDCRDGIVAVAFPLEDRVAVLGLDGRPARVFGESGGGEGQFHHPSDVALAADGSIFVADTFNQRVQCFSKVGKFVRAFGSPGPNPGQFSGPTGVAVCGDFVHVVDRDNCRVQVFTKAGELSNWYGIHALRPREGQGKLHCPLRLALDKQGARAAIAEPMEDRVQILGPVDPSATELPPLTALPPVHYGGAIDADGPLFVVNEPSIPRIQLFQMVEGEPIEIGAFGAYGAKPGQMVWPVDVAIDLAQRRIYVADAGSPRVLAFEFRFDPAEELRFDPERVRFVAEIDLLRAIAPDFMDRLGPVRIVPAGIWRDEEGGLCLCDARQKGVWRLDAGLELSGALALPDSCRAAGDGCAGGAPADPNGAREQFVVDRLGGRVFALPSGRIVSEGLVRPSGVLVTREGVCYATDEGANSLVRLVPAQRRIGGESGLGPRQFFRPRGIAELPGGRVVVIDWGNQRGMIFDREGTFQRAFGSQLFIKPTFASKVANAPEPSVAIPTAPAPVALPFLDGSKPWHAANRCASNDGRFAVFWRPTPDPIQVRENFALEIWLTSLATPNSLAKGSTVAFDAGMPEHGHGMNVVLRTTALEDGHFRVEGPRLHMPGRWEMYFDIATGDRTERAQATLQLE